MKKKGLVGAVLTGLLLVSSGCNMNFVLFDKDVKEEKVNIKKDEAEALDIELHMGAGDVNVSSGASNWVEGKIEYNQELEPVIDYKRAGETGKIMISQPTKGINLSKIINKWDLQLSDELPLDLAVHTGASNTDLDLAGIQLRDLDIHAGVGDITVDLSGDWAESFDVNLEMGVGHTTVILPKDVGVKIKASKGIGSANFKGFISKGNNVYINEAYETADVIINVTTEMGVGEADFEMK
ncbi:toast rack family protein [Cytobacillus spongiae]|uniref:toast rack family protein n=1 Tax=Cytobacillus spongiae TaxID=2901381 RepID=UPI001F38AF49|nr:toast rack family protein [Cytobacillus spongiae]UII56163.1 toast rack family protein [Cytobacillus spongiae]